MMYYFCNFMGKESKGYNKKAIESVLVSEELDANVQPAKCNIVLRNGLKSLEFKSLNEESIGEDIDILGNLSSDKVGSTNDELVSTDSNPIIVVATRKFKVYEGIPSYIKYFPVQGGVLIALIKGYISVEAKNGEMIPLSRNCDAISTEKGFIYNSESIEKLNILKDKESGLRYSDIVINDCIISHTVAKDGSPLKSIKFNKDNFVILNKEIFIEEKAKREEELRAIEEEKKRRAEEIARANEMYRLRMQQEEELKKEKVKTSRPRKVSENKETKTVSGSEGAQAFLNIVASL